MYSFIPSSGVIVVKPPYQQDCNQVFDKYTKTMAEFDNYDT